MRRAFAPVLALVLTLSLFGGLAAVDSDMSPVGTSEADILPGDCNIGQFLNFKPVCGIGDEQEEKQDLQTKVQIYQAGVSQYGAIDPFLTVYNNYMKDTEDIAWLEAERAIAQSIQNGTTKVETKINAQEAVGEYYNVKEQNFVQSWNTNAATIESLATQDDQFSEQILDAQNIGFEVEFNDPSATIEGDFEVENTTTVDYTTVNGTTVNLTRLVISFPYATSADPTTVLFEYDPITGTTVTQDAWDNTNSVTPNGNPITVDPPTDSSYTEQIDIVYHPHWSQPIDNLTSTYNSVNNDVGAYVDNAYSDINSGEVNVSEWMSNVNLANHYLTEGGQNATFSRALAALAAGGMTAHDLGGSSWMDISYQAHDSALNTTYEGVLMSGQPAPNGSWEVGVQYDTRNLPGSQSVATLSGDVATLDGNFTIEAVYDENGDVIENPDLTTPERSYDVANVTETNQLITDLGETIDELEEQIQDNRTSGGGFGIDGLPDVGLPSVGLGGLIGSIMSLMIIGVLLLLVAVASFASPTDPREGQ